MVVVLGQAATDHVQIVLEAALPIFLSKGVALTPNHLPKHHTPWLGLLFYVCHEIREQYPSSAHRLKAPGGCFDKRVGGRGIGRICALPFPLAEASKEHLVTDLPLPAVISQFRAPRDASFQCRLEYFSSAAAPSPHAQTRPVIGLRLTSHEARPCSGFDALS